MNTIKKKANAEGIDLGTAIYNEYLIGVRAREAQRKEYNEKLRQNMPKCNAYVTEDFLVRIIKSGESTGVVDMTMTSIWAQKYKECLETPTPLDIAQGAQDIIGSNFEIHYDDQLCGGPPKNDYPAKWFMNPPNNKQRTARGQSQARAETPDYSLTAI